MQLTQNYLQPIKQQKEDIKQKEVQKQENIKLNLDNQIQDVLKQAQQVMEIAQQPEEQKQNNSQQSLKQNPQSQINVKKPPMQPSMSILKQQELQKKQKQAQEAEDLKQKPGIPKQKITEKKVIGNRKNSSNEVSKILTQGAPTKSKTQRNNSSSGTRTQQLSTQQSTRSDNFSELDKKSDQQSLKSSFSQNSKLQSTQQSSLIEDQNQNNLNKNNLQKEIQKKLEQSFVQQKQQQEQNTNNMHSQGEEKRNSQSQKNVNYSKRGTDIFSQEDEPYQQNQQNQQPQIASFKQKELFQQDQKNIELVHQYQQEKQKLNSNRKDLKSNIQYYKEKEQKAKTKFMSKLYSHLEQRHKAVTRLSTEYESQKYKIQQKNIQKHSKTSKQQQQEEIEKENKEEIPINVQLINLKNCSMLKNIIDDQTNLNFQLLLLRKYFEQFLQFLNSQQQTEYLQLQIVLKSFSEFSLIDKFKSWYYCSIVQDNYHMIQKNSGDILKEAVNFKALCLQFFPKIFEFQIIKENNILNTTSVLDNNNNNDEGTNKFNKNNNNVISSDQISLIGIQHKLNQKNKQFQIIFSQNSSQQQKFKKINKGDSQHLKILINKLQIKYTFESLLENLFLQFIQKELKIILDEDKIDMKKFKEFLKWFQAIKSIVQFDCKIQPSFFLKDQFQQVLDGNKNIHKNQSNKDN